MEQFKDCRFTVVVPVYNEEGNMDALEKALAGYLRRMGSAACVLLVDLSLIHI